MAYLVLVDSIITERYYDMESGFVLLAHEPRKCRADAYGWRDHTQRKVFVVHRRTTSERFGLTGTGNYVVDQPHVDVRLNTPCQSGQGSAAQDHHPRAVNPLRFAAFSGQLLDRSIGIRGNLCARQRQRPHIHERFRIAECMGKAI